VQGTEAEKAPKPKPQKESGTSGPGETSGLGGTGEEGAFSPIKGEKAEPEILLKGLGDSKSCKGSD
jgi:hypothetical protein